MPVPIFPKVLVYFFQNPFKEVHLRELSRKLQVSPFAIKTYVDSFAKDGLVTDEKKANLRLLKANTSSLFFRYLKISYGLWELEKSGLIPYLREQIPAMSSVVLFGSMAKGESTEQSDIDILVIGKTDYVDMSPPEKKIGKEINLHIFSWAKWNKQARSNTPFYVAVIAEGIPLFGEIPVIVWK